jgi:hypothetical protein
VSNPDPLAAIKTAWLGDELHRPEYWADLASRDVPFLIGEDERLRGLLKRLEWAGTNSDMVAEESAFCLICMGWRHVGHNPGCELAAALRST